MTQTPEPSVLAQACRLRATLEALAGVLVSGDALAVLATEPCMAAVLSEWNVAAPSLDDGERHAIRQEVDRARLALGQCRATGTAIDALSSATLRATGRDDAYGRTGVPRSRSGLRGHSVRARG